MSNQTKIGGLDASLYTVTCEGDHLEEPSVARTIFMRSRTDQGETRSFAINSDGITELIMCPSPQPTPKEVVMSEGTCPLERSVWSAGTESEHIKLYYTSRPFFFLNGPVTFEKWQGNKKRWSVDTSIACSNGVPFCRLLLPISGKSEPALIAMVMVTATGEDVIQAGSSSGASFVVFPHLREMLFRSIVYDANPSKGFCAF